MADQGVRPEPVTKLTEAVAALDRMVRRHKRRLSPAQQQAIRNGADVLNTLLDEAVGLDLRRGMVPDPED